ncbi:MAG: homocysteine S-methyltransferase family protein [Sarcina sp.]
MGIREKIKSEFLVFDGAMGTMLQKKGLKLGENPEIFNIEKADKIFEVHKEYIDAGANIITTNTFGANRKKLNHIGLTVTEVVTKAIGIANEARGKKDVYIAQDIGPIGEMLEPMGTLSFDEAYDIFKEQMIAGENAGADLFIIETMTDLYEAKAALLAAKENTNIPAIVSMSFEENGRTFTGCTPASMVLTLEGLGADGIGVNCSLGPEQLLGVVKEIVSWTNLPVIVQANAGLPEIKDGEALYNVGPLEFLNGAEKFVDLGASIIGGCCGTTPEFIFEIKNFLIDKTPKKRDIVIQNALCSPSKVVKIDGVRVVGERINPTGKKLFREALINEDMDYILNQAIEQVEAGADILDVNVGLPKIDEEKIMIRTIKDIQAILDVPLQIDSTRPEVIDRALRYYNGKAIVNSINGEEEVMEAILPVIKKYGASVIGLTLDKNGIPAKAKDRVEIARKIIDKAMRYGIKKEDIYIDCLVLTASAQQKEVKETLEAVRLVKEELGVKTLLGVSNISFGLPNRKLINETFLALAFGAGLDLPIMNPNIQGMMDVVNSFKVLSNEDKDAENFINIYSNQSGNMSGAKKLEETTNEAKDLKTIVIKGLKDEAKEATKKCLENGMLELEIVNKELIPALDIVGAKYEKGEIFLPQLIRSAETVKGAFEVLKENLSKNGTVKISKGKLILATVKGDIHDIGKNIVKVILENYGYDVIDLGKDVPIETVVEKAKSENIKLVGLSALMTTTLVSMEETIKAIREAQIDTTVFVGGAVLTADYAKMIGADFYARDAKESVEIAKKIFGQ